jgi:glycosyltransferase involved in cell wall biosynthesis
MKIAIASSGLGVVTRGIETWALETALALHAAGIDVTLYAGGELPPGTETGNLPVVTLAKCPRTGNKARRLARWTPGPLWRLGLKSDYGWEQACFWWALRGELNRSEADILHVQDPMMAWWNLWGRKHGRVTTLEILAHGTEEPLTFLQQFPRLQHLAPWHLEQARSAVPINQQPTTPQLPLPPTTINHQPSTLQDPWTALPNFVDTTVFRPVASRDEQRDLRAKHGLPTEGMIVGSSAALKRDHKRVDHLIREFAAAWQACPADGRPHLLLVGASQADTPALRTLAEESAPGAITFCENVPHDQTPELYRCMDIFVLASIFEMMPIAVLEALASGLTMITNDHPVLAWMTGSHGENADAMAVEMGPTGALAASLQNLLSTTRPPDAGAHSRQRATTMFSKDAVIADYIRYYERILAGEEVTGNG